MKIAHVNVAYQGLHRRFGGAETALARSAAITRELGHDPFLITFRPDVPNPQCDLRYHAVRRWEDYMPRLMAKYSEPVKWYLWQRDSLVSADFRRIMEKERPDVVHFHNVQFFGMDTIRIASEMGAKTVYSVYDYWIFCPNVMLLTYKDEYCRMFHGAYCVDCLPPVFRGLQKALLSRRRRVFDHYMQYIDRWVALSNHSATIVKAYGIPEEKIRVVRLLLPLEYAEASRGEVRVKPNTIFFAGWLQKKKGVHVLLQAMPRILEECPEAQLRIAGHETKFDWDYKKLIADLMKQPGMDRHVTFLGHLPSKEVERELREAAVVAVPEQYENMSPVIMIEAMALERPLVISRAGGIPEFVEEGVTGWMADPRKPEEFAQKIVAILKGRVETREVGQRARQKILGLCSREDITRATMESYRF